LSSRERIKNNGEGRARVNDDDDPSTERNKTRNIFAAKNLLSSDAETTTREREKQKKKAKEFREHTDEKSKIK